VCIKHDILAALAYFDLFQYPLTQTELLTFLPRYYSPGALTPALQTLMDEGWVYRLDEFYSLQSDYSLVPRRRKGNTKARELLTTAARVARLLSLFPFVRGVAISGSLSKNYADSHSDIDLFIVTRRNRLWLARTLMHAFKKLTYLTGKQHLFCMNYYVDEAALQIREKNIYTATEIATLLPLRGIEAFKEFYAHNTWSRTLLPNHSMRIAHIKELPSSPLKRAVEIVLDHFVGNWLDTLLMKITVRRWKKKQQQARLNDRGLVLSLDGDKHYAKPDPSVFQQQLLALYEARVQHLITRYESKLKPVV
jgi:hypothetical protein